MKPIEQAVRLAMDEYLAAPTADNREALMSATDDYREQWIAVRAAVAKRNQYQREIEVPGMAAGLPVTLALQERRTSRGDSWWTLSWRTKYAVGGPNRRFYRTKDGSWMIPAKTALEMLDKMEELGGLSDAYLDSRVQKKIDTLVSTTLPPKKRKGALADVVGPDEDWGPDPFFVICSDPNELWKKVMIVASSGIATFRSITASDDYMPKKALRPGADWWLDNSMMDANVQQTREFHAHLRDYLSGKAEG